MRQAIDTITAGTVRNSAMLIHMCCYLRIIHIIQVVLMHWLQSHLAAAAAVLPGVTKAAVTAELPEAVL